jgi:MYXO-CTERM domain-containing protein
LIVRRLVSGGLALALATTALSANAFCRTMSCELGEDGRLKKCARDGHGCVTEGRPLHWASPCLAYAVQLDGSPLRGLDADQVQALAAEALAAWQTARCSGGGSPNFQALFQGYVSCGEHESVCGDASKNVNVVMLHDRNWPYDSGKIGVTSPTGGAESGLMVDADVELNSEDFAFSAGAADPSGTALKYVLAHELGHYLGLDHSDVDGALMSTSYQSLAPGEDLLSADDIAAICTAYPPGEPPACVATAPAYDSCALKAGEEPPPCKLASLSQDAKGGCSCSSAPQRAATSGRLALALFLLFSAGRYHTRKFRYRT